MQYSYMHAGAIHLVQQYIRHIKVNVECINVYVRLIARQRDIMAYNHELIASVTSY